MSPRCDGSGERYRIEQARRGGGPDCPHPKPDRRQAVASVPRAACPASAGARPVGPSRRARGRPARPAPAPLRPSRRPPACHARRQTGTPSSISAMRTTDRALRARGPRGGRTLRADRHPARPQPHFHPLIRRPVSRRLGGRHPQGRAAARSGRGACADAAARRPSGPNVRRAASGFWRAPQRILGRPSPYMRPKCAGMHGQMGNALGDQACKRRQGLRAEGERGKGADGRLDAEA